MKALLIALAVFLLTACGSSRDEPTPTPTRTPIPEVAPTEAIVAETPIPTPVMLVVTDTPVSQPDAPTLPPPTAEIVVSTATVEPTQPVATPQTATANDVANVRSGPGTDFGIVGSVAAGQALTIVGRNTVGDWYQLSDGTWIAVFLVTGAPVDVAIVDVQVIEATAAVPVEAIVEQPTAAPAVEQPTAAPAQPVSSPFTCAGGCATPPDPSCSIKGNVNSNKEKIYHTTDSSSYGNTDIKPEEGDAWFCTTQEAEAAGFRAPQNN